MAGSKSTYIKKHYISNIHDAKNKEDLKNMKLVDLKNILENKNYRTIGSKKDIIDRVWWVYHSESMEQPPNMVKKLRGRPSNSSDTKQSTPKPIEKKIKIKHVTEATSKQQLFDITACKLKAFIDSHNYRSIGSKQEIIDRVWWIMHPSKSIKPSNMEKKSRGRPTNKRDNDIMFVDYSDSGPNIPNEKTPNDVCSDGDSFDNDEDEYDTTIWEVVFVKNNNVSQHGKKYFKYKTSNYLFKETFDNDYLPYGYIEDETIVHTFTDNTYSSDLQVIIQAIDY